MFIHNLSHVAERFGKFLEQQEHPGVFLPRSAIKFLEIQVEAVPVLNPRTARDHRQGFDDARCLLRIAQAIKELIGLVGISIELKANGNFRSKYADLAQLLKQDLVETNLRDARLVNGGGDVGARKELLLTLMNMCAPHELDASISITALASSTSWPLFLTLRDTSRVIYREEEHESIDEIFPNDYGAAQINFIKSLAIDMMGHLPQLDEMCILPNGQHFCRRKRVLRDGPISLEDLYIIDSTSLHPFSNGYNFMDTTALLREMGGSGIRSPEPLGSHVSTPIPAEDILHSVPSDSLDRQDAYPLSEMNTNIDRASEACKAGTIIETECLKQESDHNHTSISEVYLDQIRLEASPAPRRDYNNWQGPIILDTKFAGDIETLELVAIAKYFTQYRSESELI
ncbi:hypothetical protein FAGAP_9227 [Fusarium agapanthi]|uniref:Uncharacterized protein n=1 Tax=Fusarium agapanthi TaxID=1803897 RepID=A0A9P5B442_9HYPO|nr:hypothetical protein FAGAP_9227 [Fusarium agapanthi]